MAGRTRIDTPTQRARLKVRREPYWHKLQGRGYLGFRRTEDSGTWIARWRDDMGKQHYRALKLPLTAPDQAFDDAIAAARTWFKTTTKGIVALRTVQDAAERYVQALQLRKGETAARDAKGRIDRCIVPQLGGRPLDRITTAEIEEWLHGLVSASKEAEETRKAKDSANRNLTTLKALLNNAWRTGLVGSNAAWSRVRSFEGVGRARDVFLTLEQRRRLLAQCEGVFCDLIEAALLTGARYGELRAVKVADFDRGRRVLSIRHGKTGPRAVPLPNAAIALFTRLSKGKLPGAFLLTRSDGVPWQHSDHDELMREAAKRAKLPRGTVFYTLRHSFIASALTGGVDIYTVAKMCGTSVRMIEQHYGKLLQGDARERLNRIALT